jgi:type IV pilus biogenesis protein CpaD/CtpE
MPDVTSMKLSTETRDRLRMLAAETDAASLEDVVVMALDAYSAQQFWAAAEAADASETAAQRIRRRSAEDDVDGWMARL